MFFNAEDDILEIAKNTGFSIFVLQSFPEYSKPNILALKPDEKTKKINIDSIRELLTHTSSKKTSDQFFIVYYPEKMSAEASNAFLKNLEEPKDNYHFIFFTKDLSMILPTILSRAQIFIEDIQNKLDSPIETSDEIKNFAKRLIASTEKNLPMLAKEISDKKDRSFTLEIISTAIEMSYKTFFLTNDVKFLKKLSNLIELYQNINANGNMKLHIIADMI